MAQCEVRNSLANLTSLNLFQTHFPLSVQILTIHLPENLCFVHVFFLIDLGTHQRSLDLNSYSKNKVIILLIYLSSVKWRPGKAYWLHLEEESPNSGLTSYLFSVVSLIRASLSLPQNKRIGQEHFCSSYPSMAFFSRTLIYEKTSTLLKQVPVQADFKSLII